MSAHTPGPWCSYRTDVYQELDVEFIADCDNGQIDDLEKAYANARLIAAAPDLLAALLAVNSHNAFSANKFPLEIMEPVRAAIAKATQS